MEQQGPGKESEVVEEVDILGDFSDKLIEKNFCDKYV